MKAVMVMFDTLNRRHLPPYGCDWTHAPNFQRLAKRTVTFDRSFVCSMPCMPARRDLHTGRPNFLHRSWGPIEPFDDSVPRMLHQAGIHSALITDHQHYFEAGGGTYHTQYSSWQFFRGQEGDSWMGQVADPPAAGAPNPHAAAHPNVRQDRINRQFMRREQDQPQARTFEAGIDFIRRNADADNWFVQIETFDPHEPFFTQRHYQDLYRQMIGDTGPVHDWPLYGRSGSQTDEVAQQLRGHYAALLAMCDKHLGDVLDTFDQLNLWQDTMLIVWTDHGFLLGEHDLWAKCQTPYYNEIAHTPFFAWDPRSSACDQRRQALVQPALDLGPTLLEFFGIDRTPDMLGQPLRDTIARDAPLREAAVFGHHGGQVNVTDGRYVYMRGPARNDNQPIYNYTLMPTHMKTHFSLEELRDAVLTEPHSFTKNTPTLKIPAAKGWNPTNRDCGSFNTMLFDVQADPAQENPLHDQAIEQRMTQHLIRLMQACDAPPEQYERLGL